MNLKPPKRRLRARQRPPKPSVDHAVRFDQAMRAVVVEDWLAKPENPCMLCGAPTTWAAARVTEFDDGRARLEIVYLCQHCQDNGGIARLDTILDEET